MYENITGTALDLFLGPGLWRANNMRYLTNILVRYKKKVVYKEEKDLEDGYAMGFSSFERKRKVCNVQCKAADSQHWVYLIFNLLP